MSPSSSSTGPVLRVNRRPVSGRRELQKTPVPLRTVKNAAHLALHTPPLIELSYNMSQMEWAGRVPASCPARPCHTSESSTSHEIR